MAVGFTPGSSSEAGLMVPETTPPYMVRLRGENYAQLHLPILGSLMIGKKK